MLKEAKVILVEDTASLAATYKQYLREEPIELIHVDNGVDAQAAIARHIPDLVLLDIQMPARNGIMLGSDFSAYLIDSWQRSILFADVMRQRGNQFAKADTGLCRDCVFIGIYADNSVETGRVDDGAC